MTRGSFAIGGTDASYRASPSTCAGVSKFVLRPAVTGDEAAMSQTQRLSEVRRPCRWLAAKKQE